MYVKRSLAAAACAMAVAAVANAGTSGVFTENTGQATDSSFGVTGAGTAPYGWLAPVGDTSKMFEIYRKRTGGAGSNDADVTLTNNTGPDRADINNERFGGSYVTDLGNVFGTTTRTTGSIGGKKLAVQLFNNMTMEFRVGFIEKTDVGTGWLNNHFGDNRIGNWNGTWGPCEDLGDAPNGADTLFLQVKTDSAGVVDVGYGGATNQGGLYLHSGSDLVDGQNQTLLDKTGTDNGGTVGSGLQEVDWSLTPAGPGLADFSFSFGGYSYTRTGISLTTDGNGNAFKGGSLDLNDVVPVIYIGGQVNWGLAGTGAAVSVTPEPATLGLLGLGGLLAMKRRRRS